MASGHGVPKPDKADHQNRKVPRDQYKGERQDVDKFDAITDGSYDALKSKWQGGARLSAEEGNSTAGRALRNDIYGYD